MSTPTGAIGERQSRWLPSSPKPSETRGCSLSKLPGMFVPGRMVCAVCGRVLDRYEGQGYAHSLPEDADHVAVPVPDTQMQPEERCDFCYTDHTEWLIPARNFVVNGHGSEGDWAACEDCYPFIPRNDWNGLLRHVKFRWQQRHEQVMPAEMEKGIKALYRGLRKNMSGAPRKL